MEPGTLVVLRKHIGNYLWYNLHNDADTSSFRVDHDETFLLIAEVNGMALVHSARQGRCGWKKSWYLRNAGTEEA